MGTSYTSLDDGGTHMNFTFQENNENYHVLASNYGIEVNVNVLGENVGEYIDVNFIGDFPFSDTTRTIIGSTHVKIDE